jgi:type VI secretion system secreted protein Hcp
MGKKSLYIGVIVTCLLIVPSSGFANVDIFMYIEGIPGECINDDYKDWIDVFAFSEGLSKKGIANNNAVNRMVITKWIDKSTPPLLIKRYAGEELSEPVIIEMRRAGEPSFCFLKIELGDVTVESVTTEVTTETEVLGPIENIAIRFKFIRISYTPQNPDGSPGAAIVREFSF